MTRHADLKRTELLDRDSRIYPGSYVPVMIWEDGKRVVKPMRYGCRPAGKPAFYDVKVPGHLQRATRQPARLLEGPVRPHARPHRRQCVLREREPAQGRGRDLAPGEEVENLVLEFKPRPTQDMLVACLWSKWTGPNEPDLLSFAAITDEPPAEVAAAGHDRCIVPIKPENVDAWLNPANTSADRLLAMLEDRERPYYEHRMAAWTGHKVELRSGTTAGQRLQGPKNAPAR